MRGGKDPSRRTALSFIAVAHRTHHRDGTMGARGSRWCKPAFRVAALSPCVLQYITKPRCLYSMPNMHANSLAHGASGPHDTAPPGAFARECGFSLRGTGCRSVRRLDQRPGAGSRGSPDSQGRVYCSLPSLLGFVPSGLEGVFGPTALCLGTATPTNRGRHIARLLPARSYAAPVALQPRNSGGPL